jgi:hypothetical protein
MPTRAELEEISDEEIMEISGNQFAPRKRKISKAKLQVHERHLRRSKRSATKQGGFKKDVLHSVPLDMIPVHQKRLHLPQHPYCLWKWLRG